MSVVVCSLCGRPSQEAMHLPSGTYRCLDREACAERVAKAGR